MFAVARLDTPLILTGCSRLMGCPTSECRGEYLSGLATAVEGWHCQLCCSAVSAAGRGV